MKLFYVENMPIARIDQAIIVAKPARCPIWQSYRAEPCPEWKTSRDEDWFSALIADIRRYGVRNPVILWEYDGCGAMAPVKGASRLAACKALGIDTVPAFVSAEAAPEVRGGVDEYKPGALSGVACSFIPQPTMIVWRPDGPLYAEFPRWEAPKAPSEKESTQNEG